MVKGEEKVKERSHVVTSGKMGKKRKFKKAVKALGKKYGQDSVLTQDKKGGATLSATRKGGLPKRKIPIGKFRASGRTGEMDTN